jgi:hypothetical protein
MKDKIYKLMELTKNIRLRRLQWVGHVTRLKEKGCQGKLKGYKGEEQLEGSEENVWMRWRGKLRLCLNAGIGRGWHRIERPGGGGLKMAGVGGL